MTSALVMVMLTPAWHLGGVPRGMSRRSWPITCLVEANEQCVQEQRDAYFALMPSQALPTSSLDLRPWASKDDDNVEAQIMARQIGTVEKWVNIGVVATVTEVSLSAAVAKQRDLIVRWAYEACNDFETNKLLMDLDGPPIEIAWVKRPPKPSLFDSLSGKKAPSPSVNAVQMDVPYEQDLRCGFLGKLSREYRGGGVSSRWDRIVIGKEPEVPARLESQAKFDNKY